MFGLLLGLLGFTKAGVAAGSIAAWVQSTFYGAFTCGLFSSLQSAGATAAVAGCSPLLAVLGLLGWSVTAVDYRGAALWFITA